MKFNPETRETADEIARKLVAERKAAIEAAKQKVNPSND